MTCSNAINELLDRLRNDFPSIECAVDRPRDSDGVWWIDLRRDDLELTIQWSSKQGFGLFTDEEVGFGDLPTEIFRDTDFAARRIAQLLRKEGDPLAMTVGDLRGVLDVTQHELARKAGVRQASVSKFERRDSVKLDTLAQYVSALGGVAWTNVHFPQFDAVIPLRMKESDAPAARGKDRSKGSMRQRFDAVPAPEAQILEWIRRHELMDVMAIAAREDMPREKLLEAIGAPGEVKSRQKAKR